MHAVPNLHNWRKNLSPESLGSLDKYSITKKVKKGQYLYHQKEWSNCGYQVVSGRINITTLSESGEQLILSTLHSGDCFGDSSLLTGESRPFNAVACTEGSVKVLYREHFTTVCTQYPEILISINALLCQRIRMLSEMLEDAHLQSVYIRLAKVLVKLALSQGRKQDDTKITVDDISQENLGLMVGATRQSIARELKKMESEDLVYLHYRTLTIPNLAKMLSHFEHFLPTDHIVASYTTD